MKGKPAYVQIYEYPQLSQVLASKHFYKAQTVDFSWNSTGDALLVSTHTDVDKSGKSYYGEDGLHFLCIDGKSENITLGKEGPIQESRWNPNGTEFVVIYGYMPPKATLFGIDGKPRADFGATPRNTAIWSPNGRILAIAGFGNLQGDIDFWDPKRVKKIGSCKAHCAVHCEWSPDGNYLLTAVLSPRIRVDNGYQVWNHDGTLIHQETIEELYQMMWRPALPGIFPNKPLVLSKQEEAVSSPSQTPPAKYRHPNFSGSAAVIREDEKPQKYEAPKKATDAYPPGYVPPKNKKKKQKKPGESKPSTTTTTTTSKSPPPPIEDEGERQKRIRNLTKKLRQITSLKEEQEAGKQLDESQLLKIAQEEEVLDELNSL